MASLLAASCGNPATVGSSGSATCPPGLMCLPECPSGYVCYPTSPNECPPGYPPGTVCIPECPSGYVCYPEGTGGRAPGTATTGAAGAPTTGGGGASTTGAGGSAGTGGGVSTPLQSATVSVLDYDVVDAKFSQALTSIVMVSSTPSNALHAYDVVHGTDRTVALPAVPVAVAVEPNGLAAAVAYDANVSWVDLMAGTVTKTCSISSDAFDVVVASSGVAYVMPATDQWVQMHIVDPATCAETLTTGIGALYAASHLGLHPSEKAVFAADNGLSPSRIDRCDLSSLVCDDSEGQNDWGTYEYCGNLWMSADGERIYSACGATLKVPGDVTTSLCSYGGTLPGVDLIRHMSEATQAQRVVFVPGVNQNQWPQPNTSADAVVRVHETNFLQFVAEYSLPAFPLPSNKTAVAHGHYVFTTPGMDKLYAVVQADPSAGALHDFAIATMVP